MQSKQFGLFFVGILALIFVMSAVSAAIVLNPTTQALSVGQGNSGSFTFTIQNTDGASTYSNFTSLSSVSNLVSGANTIASSNIVLGTLPTTLAPGVTSSAISVTVNVPSNQSTGTYTGTITIDADGSTTNPIAQTIGLKVTVTSTIPTEVQTCTTTGNPGSLKIKKIDLTGNGYNSSYAHFGEDDKWFPFESVDTQIDVKNDGDDDVNNIEVDWGLWDTKNLQWVIEPDNFKDFDLGNGKTKTLSTSFKVDDRMDVDLSDLGSGGSHYKFYVIATGEVDNATSPSSCVSKSQDAEIVIESDFVVVNKVDMPQTVQCGATVQVAGELTNVGDNDQDKVSLVAYGRETALNIGTQKMDIGDMNAFDSKSFSFTFKVPNNLEEKSYGLKLEVKDENDDVYQNDFNDDYSEYTIPFTVKGNCGVLSTQATITASLESAAKAGQPLVVKTTIKNNEDSLKTYSVNAAEYAQWASSVSADQSTVVLNAGESRDVKLTFNVNKDASGAQTFFVETVSGSDVARQQVSVNIEPRTGFASSLSDLVSGGSSIWLIGLLNVILVVVIIVVAVRLARK